MKLSDLPRCYLCDLTPVSAAVEVVIHYGRGEERKPGICSQCKRAHLEASPK